MHIQSLLLMTMLLMGYSSFAQDSISLSFSSGESLYLTPDNKEVTFFYGNENFSIDKFIPTESDILIYSKSTNSIKCISREDNLVTDEYCISDLFHSNTKTNVQIKNRSGKVQRKTIETIRFNGWYMLNDSVLYAGIFKYKKEDVVLLIKVKNHKFIAEPVSVCAFPLICRLVQTMPDILFGLRKIVFAQKFEAVSMYTNSGTGDQRLDIVVLNESQNSFKIVKSFYNQAAVNNLDLFLFYGGNKLFVKPLDSDSLFVLDSSGQEIKALPLQAICDKQGTAHWSVYTDYRTQDVYFASFMRDFSTYMKLYRLKDGSVNLTDSFSVVSFSVPYRDLCIYNGEMYLMLENKNLLSFDVYKMPLVKNGISDTVSIHFFEPHSKVIKNTYDKSSNFFMGPSSMKGSDYKVYRESSVTRYFENFSRLQTKYPQSSPLEILTSVASTIKSSDLRYLYACLFAWEDLDENIFRMSDVSQENKIWLPDEITDKLFSTVTTILSDKGIIPNEFANERSFEISDPEYIFNFIKIRKKWYLANSILKKVN